MKRLFSLAAIFAVALFFSFSAMAQAPATAPSPQGTAKKEPAQLVSDKPGISYKQVRVLKGGNLALIAERCGHTQAGWRPLYAVNQDRLPKAETFGEMWRVLVQPRQILNLPAGWSYQTLNPEYVEPFLPVPQEARSPEGTTPPIAPISSIGGGGSLWLLDPVWALILIILAALAFLAAIAVPLIRRRDPNRYPSRIPGGLSDNPETAVRQIGIAYPGRRYERIERCRLARDGGPRRILVRRMDFGDGVSRDAYLNDGDQVYRGRSLASSSYDYFLRSCGNLGPEFQLPNGWRVVVIESQDIGPTVYEPPMTASATPPVPPAPPIPPAPVFLAEPVSESTPVPAPEPELAPVLAELPAAEPAPKPTAEAETSVAVDECEQTLTASDVEVTVDGLLIRVVGKNGNIPATKIRTGGGVKVTIRQP